MRPVFTIVPRAMPVTTESAASSPTSAAKRRPAPELVIKWFFGPLAELVARALAPLLVPPPAVVIANACAGLGAAALVWRGELVASALLLQLKTLLDNTDGRLARRSERVTLFGRYLDSEADLVVSLGLFGAVGAETGQPLLALASFLVSTTLLSVGFMAARLYWNARNEPVADPPPSGGALERVAARVYAVVYGPQDRLFGSLLEGRLARLLDGVSDAEIRHRARLAYHDRATMAVLANLGLSTQLTFLGICLVLGSPAVYLWALVAVPLPLAFLQLRRERLARRAVSGRRAA